MSEPTTLDRTSEISKLDLYRLMLTIRRAEERAQDLRGADLVAGSIHLCCGQEAIPAGACAVLGAEDRVVATYRGHGWALACGVPLAEFFAEICGRATGTNGGRGGAAYMTAPRYGFIGENSIVGAGLPIANGLAFAARARETGGVAVVSFGDGATNQGATHEGLVMAATQSLPVIFVCENNGWSEMTPITAMSRVTDLASRADGYGLPGVVVDGNDPVAVAGAVAEARERAACGGGPTFLECKTTRLYGHYNADVEHYRSQKDKEAARGADPVLRLRARLLDETDIDADELDRVDSDVERVLEVAQAEALAAPFPDPATARDHVF
ncbi:MAG: 2-oxoisovalerate dehydrogenase component, partial [Acidimicrobiaceae bacterium]